jgi:hypothetical protein
MTDRQRESEFDNQSDAPGEVSFHFIKSNFFRVIHVDGIWGGLTPDGNLHISLYSERPAIPSRMVFRLSNEGELDDEIQEKRVSKDGIVREVESSLILDMATTVALRNWLDGVIDHIENIENESENG